MRAEDPAAGKVDAEELMERIVAPGNLATALLNVARNKGTPGVDGRSIEEVVGALDRVHHQWLLSRLGQRITDDRVPVPIKRVLKAKVVIPDGTRVGTPQGTPQGGPLSPLLSPLSNVVLDELDQ